MMQFSRANRSVIAQWWWTVDRWMLVALFILVILGAVLSLAASPAVANRLGLSSFHFVYRHALFVLPSLALMFAVSMLPPRQVRRLAVIVFSVGLGFLALTLVWGTEIKGAHRWLNVGGFALQPSEFVKPAFVVVAAWMFSEGLRHPAFPGAAVALLLYALVACLLVLQPDFGQMMLVTLVFSALFFMAGLSWRWIGLMGTLAVAGAAGAYSQMPHVTSRVDRFLDPGTGDTFQIDRALEAVRTGGFFGRGPGEGVVKRILPDAHTDFIFAVVAEEFGVLLAVVVIGLFCFIVMRSFNLVMDAKDRFVQLAASGLAALFGLQALINLAVNVNLLPAKGMTLPFISYGGSSMLAMSFGMGMLLALTRRRVSHGEGLGASMGRAAWAPARGEVAA